jgi:DNA polymerase III alpha subunit
MSPKDTYLARREGRQKVPERHQILTTALKETYGLFVFQEQVIASCCGIWASTR